MSQPLVCMTLSCKTLEENVQLVQKYQKYIDLVELRVDYLNEDEQLYVRRFPSMIYQPCILTIRRDIDGGKFTSGEFSRTNLFGRALAFANQDRAKNFAYVDFEDDYHIPSIQDAAMAFGVKIIRSYHNMQGPVFNIRQRCEDMRKTGYEIPKIVFKVNKLSDVSNMFKEAAEMTDYEHILCALGVEGMPSRILSAFTNSYLTYTSPEETLENTAPIGHLDPITLNNLYNFRAINKETKIFGITGWPATRSKSPEIHNIGYKKIGLNAVYVPVRSPLITEAINFANQIGINGMSITIPHKESIIYYLKEQSPEVAQIGSCNSIVKKENGWVGYNTEVYGVKRALQEFLGPFRIKHKKVALLGAGSSAKAIAYVLKQMGARVCIFNRTVENARQLAEKYGFKYSPLEPSCASLLDEYSNLIIQATSVGMEKDNPSDDDVMDPIPFYNFRGDELLFDIICKPAITHVMQRATLAGCRVENGYRMLEYQAYRQFKLFTGMDFEDNNIIDTIF